MEDGFLKLFIKRSDNILFYKNSLITWFLFPKIFIDILKLAKSKHNTIKREKERGERERERERPLVVC